MRDCFRLLAVVNLILLPLAITVYADRFLFFSLALSDLGLPVTPGGQGNYAALVTFALNMTIGSACMTWYAVSSIRAGGLPYRRVKATLAITAAIGFLVGIFPHDPYHVLHLAGCAAMVGSLWFLANLFSIELRALGRSRNAVTVQLVLQATVLPYAAAYFAGSELKQALQKFAIAGLFVSLTIATRHLREAVLVRATRVAAWNSAVRNEGTSAGTQGGTRDRTNRTRRPGGLRARLP